MGRSQMRCIRAMLFMIIALGSIHLLPVLAQSGDFDSGTVFLRNGDSIVGEVKMVWHSNDILFREAGARKKKKYNYKTVKRVQMTGYETNAYSYKIIDGGGGIPKLLREIDLNSNLSLYMDSDQQYRKKTRTGSTLKVGRVRFVEQQVSFEPTLIPIWFVGHGTSDFVRPIPENRAEVMQLYNDCQAVILKYRNVEDENFYIPEFVRFYNEECQ